MFAGSSDNLVFEHLVVSSGSAPTAAHQRTEAPQTSERYPGLFLNRLMDCVRIRNICLFGWCSLTALRELGDRTIGLTRLSGYRDGQVWFVVCGLS